MNVAETEELVEQLLAQKSVERSEPERGRPRRQRTYIIKDVRLFMNTVRHALQVMKRSGLAADMGEQDEGDTILITIRIPKRANQATPQ